MMPYVKVMRPQTLIAAIAPVIGAYLFAKSQASEIEKSYFLLCLIIGVCIQIATNIFNDLVDGKNGVDVDRIGDQRWSSTLIRSRLWLIAYLFLFVSLIATIPLAQISLLYIPIGILSLFLTYMYTGGPYPLAYNGLGEIFVYLFFGLVSFSGTYYTFFQTLTLESFLCASFFGILSVLIIYANNYRDQENDRKFRKNTIAVRFNKQSKALFYFFISLDIIHKILLYIIVSNFWILFSLITSIILFKKVQLKHESQMIFKFCILNLLISSLFYGLSL